ncbi:MAG: DUF305 domain-containing protein [Candidatus Levybacteria bacterium]|nr:DUF305 domain-containing protein [Candidatus Levybacteria bacterium]
MKNENIKYGIGGIMIGGFLVWLLSFNTINSNNYGMMGMMGFRNQSQQIVQKNSNTMDAHFIEQMIPHHEDAITMSKLALTKAQRPEVKTLATNIINSQSKEITDMKTWYKEWYGRELPTGSNVMRQHGMMGGGSMHMGIMGDDNDLVRLSSSSDFDREFVEEMIPHHQMAVMMARMLKNGTTRSEMKTLAENIISSQSEEITLMRGWLTEWSK